MVYNNVSMELLNYRGIELSDDSDYLFVYASDVIGEKNLYYINLQDGIRAGMELHLLFDGKRGSHYVRVIY